MRQDRRDVLAGEPLGAFLRLVQTVAVILPEPNPCGVPRRPVISSRFVWEEKAAAGSTSSKPWG
jgi:hypothetical protein